MALQLSERWADRGACVGFRLEHGNAEWVRVWFPKFGSTQRAKDICATCEVREECLEYCFEAGIKFGIWGGTTEYERRKLRREWKVEKGITSHVVNLEVMPCGTNAAYHRHRRRGEQPCPACREAYAKYRQATRPTRAKT